MGRRPHKQLLDVSNSLGLWELGRPGSVPCLSTGVPGYHALERQPPTLAKPVDPRARTPAPGFLTAPRVSSLPSLFSSQCKPCLPDLAQDIGVIIIICIYLVITWLPPDHVL